MGCYESFMILWLAGLLLLLLSERIVMGTYSGPGSEEYLAHWWQVRLAALVAVVLREV